MFNFKKLLLTTTVCTICVTMLVGCAAPEPQTPDSYLSFAERVSPEQKAEQTHPSCPYLAVDQPVQAYAYVVTPYVKGYKRFGAPMRQQTTEKEIRLTGLEDRDLSYFRFRCDKEKGELTDAEGLPYFSSRPQWVSRLLIPGISVSELVCAPTQAPVWAKQAARCKTRSGDIVTERYVVAPGFIAEVLITGSHEIKAYLLVPRYLESIPLF